MNSKLLSFILVTFMGLSTTIESSHFANAATKLGVTTKELGHTIAAGTALVGTAAGYGLYKHCKKDTKTTKK